MFSNCDFVLLLVGQNISSQRKVVFCCLYDLQVLFYHGTALYVETSPSEHREQIDCQLRINSLTSSEYMFEQAEKIQTEQHLIQKKMRGSMIQKKQLTIKAQRNTPCYV